MSNNRGDFSIDRSFHEDALEDEQESSAALEPSIGLVPAAGMARRLNIDTPKELVCIGDKAAIEYGIDHLVAAGIQDIVVVIREGKEAVRAHVEQTYPLLSLKFIYQTGPIGNLLHAIQAAYPAINHHTVYFCMADVIMAPNPFCIQPTHELSLLCQSVSDGQWQHLGVVDPIQRRIVDKPTHFISNICWGALIWRSTFTETIMRATDLTSAMNRSDWSYFVNIQNYVDIGIDSSQIQPFVFEGTKRYEFIG